VQAKGFLFQTHSDLSVGHLISLQKLLTLAQYSAREKNVQNAEV